MDFDPIPQARVVRKAGQLVAPPRGPKTREVGPSLGDRVKEGLALAIGLWPLTAVMLLMVGLIIMAGNSGH
jgi:preprotein translocase subunit SecD